MGHPPTASPHAYWSSRDAVDDDDARSQQGSGARLHTPTHELTTRPHSALPLPLPAELNHNSLKLSNSRTFPQGNLPNSTLDVFEQRRPLLNSTTLHCHQHRPKEEKEVDAGGLHHWELQGGRRRHIPPRGQTEPTKASDLDIYNDNDNDSDTDRDNDDERKRRTLKKSRNARNKKSNQFSFCGCFTKCHRTLRVKSVKGLRWNRLCRSPSVTKG